MLDVLTALIDTAIPGLPSRQTVPTSAPDEKQHGASGIMSLGVGSESVCVGGKRAN